MLNQPRKFHLLLHSAHLVEERLRARLAPLGVQPRQARVLDALQKMGESSQVDLARAFSLSAASMSTMTVRMLKAGLIERHVDERELRSNVLKLSKLGENLLQKIYLEWQGLDLEIHEHMGTDNAEHLASLTLQLRDALGGVEPGGEPSDGT